MSAVLAGLVTAAGGMAVATAYLIAAAARVRSAAGAATVVFVLGMMATMLAGASVVLDHPSPATLRIGLAVGGVGMAVLGFAAFAILAGAPARPDGGSPEGFSRGWLVSVVAGLVLASELLMGRVFPAALAWATSGTPASSGSPIDALVAAVDSPWFLGTMGAEMGITTALLWTTLDPTVRWLLAGQAAIMLLSPPAGTDPRWVVGATAASSAVMIGLFVAVLEHLYRHRQPSDRSARYLAIVLAIYGLMMAGLVEWLGFGDGTLFAGAILLEMIAFLEVVGRPDRLAGPPGEPWTLRPRWTFVVLSTIFVAELFMGAALDLALLPGTFRATLLPPAPVGLSSAALAADAVRAFWFVATVTASTWFLAMMGAEMGALVVYKIRESKATEHRLRLGLMLGCYAAFAVVYPSTYFAALVPTAPDPRFVPVLGWSMGIGSYPLAADVLAAVVLTYVVTGAASALFGRRAICSTLCTAATMFQGTAVDAMKTFNRTSPIARRYLSSRFSTLYSATSTLVVGSLGAVAALSFLDARGTLHVSFAGADPTVFAFALYFSVLWYLLFVSIPYVGTYSCVTMGYCYTGAIAQAFHRVGFFKLKVRDPAVCRSCTTLDCAKGCPVGLVDMPGHFRSSGEFRSSKCCGVGDCAEDCPYGNLYLSDVRHWLRRRLGRPEVAPDRPLPMVRVRPSSGRVSAAPPPAAARAAVPARGPAPDARVPMGL